MNALRACLRMKKRRGWGKEKGRCYSALSWSSLPWFSSAPSFIASAAVIEDDFNAFGLAARPGSRLSLLACLYWSTSETLGSFFCSTGGSPSSHPPRTKIDPIPHATSPCRSHLLHSEKMSCMERSIKEVQAICQELKASKQLPQAVAILIE